MNTRIAYLQWLALGAALLAVFGVWYFASAIAQGQADRAAGDSAMQESADKQALAVRTHALMADTVQERTQLGALLTVDVVSVANMIEAAGKAAGVTVKLGDAVPENAPAAQGGLSIQAIGFVVEAQGKFPALMRALELFETLPIPSTLTRFDMQKVPDSSGAPSVWHMSAYIRVLTTSNISS